MEKQTCFQQQNKAPISPTANTFLNGTLSNGGALSNQPIFNENLHQDACFIWRRFAK